MVNINGIKYIVCGTGFHFAVALVFLIIGSLSFALFSKKNKGMKLKQKLLEFIQSAIQYIIICITTFVIVSIIIIVMAFLIKVLNAIFIGQFF